MGLADVKDQGVPVGGDQGVGELVDTATPEVGTGPSGRIDPSLVDLGVGDELTHRAPGSKPVVQATLGVDIVILEVECPQFGVGPFEAVTLDIALEKSLLGNPVQG